MRNKFYAAVWRVLRPLVLFFLAGGVGGAVGLKGGGGAGFVSQLRRLAERWGGTMGGRGLGARQ